MDIFNIVFALIGAVVGAILGHHFTIKLSKNRAAQQKKALYNEVLIIQTEFVNYLKPLIDEFNEPLRQKYFGPPVIYTRLIENLMVELSGTDEIISIEQRKFLVRIGHKDKALSKKDTSRSEFIERWLVKNSSLDVSEKLSTEQSIQFWTAHLLREVVDIIFHASKFLEEKDNFMFREYSLEQKIIAVCKYSDITYKSSFWTKVIQR
ncbi:hypothetical protein [Vibrio metschnikovii]|uniref:hypothetical protein n=1 Tax=Vibrio metschnikovii TaxID=28172 RepID=UPI001C30C3EB|nr:hypothetical protein [Vibrio metschnikovii]